MARKTFLNGYPLPASDLNTYLMDQTVQTYADATARTAALATPTEGQMSYLEDTNTAYVYDGSSWNAVVDAKNYGATLPNGAAGRNKIINGGFDIGQRLVSGTKTITSSGYGLDRWYLDVGGSTIVSQQTTGVPVSSYNCMRVTINGGAVANSIHALESREAKQFWGKTVTLSVKLRRNASFAGNLQISVSKSVTVDAAPNAANYTSIGSSTVTNAQLPTGTSQTDWYSATVSVAIPSDGTANSIRVAIAQTAGESSGAYYEVAEVQFEAGSVATPFSRAGGTIQGELAACQRYYYRETAGTPYGRLGFGMSSSTTTAQTVMRAPVTMRVTPTSVDYPTVSTIRISDISAGTTLSTLVLLNQSTPDELYVAVTVASGLTAYRPYYLEGNNSSTAYIGFSAEL